MFRRTTLQVLVIVAAAFAAGLLSNAVRATLEWGGDDPVLVHNKVPDVSMSEAAQKLDDPTTLFLDARPRSDYDAGHIRGALSFSSDDFPAAYTDLRDYLGEGVHIIVYGDDVLSALRAAQFLQARGHAPRALEGGWKAWTERQLPVEAGQNP
jgi:3-mercaptopyruvate sulfurtransferase SseA